MPDAATALSMLDAAVSAPPPSSGGAAAGTGGGGSYIPQGNFTWFPDKASATTAGTAIDTSQADLVSDMNGPNGAQRWAWIPRGGFGSGQGAQDPDALGTKLDMLAQGARGKFQAPAPASPPATASSMIGNVGAGANDAIAGTLGAPVDLATGALNLGARGINAVAGTNIPQITNPVGGSDSIKTAMGWAGADPRSIPVNNTAEQVARAGGSGVAGAVLPFGAARALAGGVLPFGVPALRTMSPAVNGVTNALGAGSLGGNAAIGGVSGATGQVAANQVPQPWKPLANFGGQMAGGIPSALAMAAARYLASTGTGLAKSYLSPFAVGLRTDFGPDAAGNTIKATGNQAAAAGNRLLGASSSKGGLPDALNEGLENPELVPGSQPTLHQLTGDPGLGQLERVQRTKNPALFQARGAAQNSARVNAIEGIAPAGSESGAVGQYLTQRLSDLDANTDSLVQAAHGRAARAVQSLGGNQTAEQYGRALRSELAGARLQAKINEQGLWNAIDPRGKLALDASPTKQAAAELSHGGSAMAKPISGEEAEILKIAGAMPRVVPFRDFTALRGRLLDAIAAERMSGATPALRRMQQLRAAMDDTIATGADRQAQQEAAAVQAGRMAPEQTAAARLVAEARSWYSRRDAGQIANTGTAAEPQNGGRSFAGNASGRSGRVSPVLPGEMSTIGRSGDVSGAPGLSEEPPLESNFDQDATYRYRGAANATRERASTYDAGPVGSALRAGANRALYNMADSQVAARFFNGGSKSFEDVNSFLRAAGNRPTAVATLQDFAASSLRQAAENPDGTLNAAKYAKWMDAHSDALRVFPELAEKFDSVAKAQRSLEGATAMRKDALDTFENGVARHFLGDKDPIDAVAAALRRPDRVAAMGELARLTASDPAARAGLERAIVEHVQRDLISNSGDIKGDMFQTFWNKRADALAQVFSPAQLKTMEAVAADLDRSARSFRTKLPGGPGTAQDVTGVAQHAAESGEGHSGSLLNYAVLLGMEHATGSAGLVGVIGVGMARAMRATGLRTVDGLVTEAMLNPALARVLLTKATQGNAAFAGQVMRQQLGRRLAGMGAVAAVTSTRQ